MAATGLSVLIKGWVSRLLPQTENDNDASYIRLGRYGDVYTVGAVRKQHILADEGSYFLANNGGTGVATAAAPTSFSDTAPMLSITNNDVASNSGSKRIHLDFVRLMETAAGTAGTGLRIQLKTDVIDRYSSGGTALTPVSPNADVPQRASIATVRMLPTNAAVGGQARTLLGDILVIPTQTGALAAFSTAHLNFGGVESGNWGWNTAASAAVAIFVHNLPPVVIGPGQTMILNFLIPSQSAASSWTPEVGWWER